MAKKKKELTINERWEQGVAHDPRSVTLYKGIADIDFKDGGDYFCFKSGGDGDNGEHLMYLLDIYFERKDKTIVVVKQDATDEELSSSVAALDAIK
jgi:hypothetical protein